MTSLHVLVGTTKGVFILDAATWSVRGPFCDGWPINHVVGDPATGEPIGDTEANFKASIAGETYEYTQMYPGFSKTARDEGFTEIADWFETLARAEKSHAGRFAQGLESL